MRLFSREKPKIKVVQSRPDRFSGWLKCTKCNEMVHGDELKKNFHCCPKCEYHYRFTVGQRIELLCDQDSFVEMFDDIRSEDPLNFTDSKDYPTRLKQAQESSKATDAVKVGTCTIGGHAVCLGVMNFNFMAGSMGSVVGERLARIIEFAIENESPVVIVSASGGARMQESIFSLMQMAKISAALAKLSEKQLPFISILTNPTSGGVTASFAALGDIIIAEPEALICFAGPRVVEQVIRQKLPKGAQKSEFLLKHGMIDMICPRSSLKKNLMSCLSYLGRVIK